MSNLLDDTGLVPDVLLEAPADAVASATVTMGQLTFTGTPLGVLPAAASDMQPARVSFPGADPTKLYTVFLTDPDAPSRAKPIYREFLHWAVTNAPAAKTDSADVLLPYVSSAPPHGSGPHRYVFLVFEQTAGRLDGAAVMPDTYPNRGGQKVSAFAVAAAAAGNPLKLVAAAVFEAEWDAGCDAKHAALGFVPPHEYQSPAQRKQAAAAAVAAATQEAGGAGGGDGGVDDGSHGTIQLPKLGFGCWQLGSKGSDDYWQVEYTQEMANRMVRLAAENGFSYFDSAGDYGGGDSERQLGVALRELDPALRAQCVVGTKIVPNNCDDVEHHLTDQLERLQMDCVDLYMVHWPIDKNSMSHFAAHNTTGSGGRDYAAVGDVAAEAVPPATRAFQELQRLQAAGKIRHVGVSNFGVKQLQEALATGVKLAVNQVCYNLLFRAAELEVIPFCERHGIKIICYSPLQQALLTGRWLHADDVPTYRARSRHFRGTRPKSRHGEDGHERLTFKTIAELQALCTEWAIEMSDLAIAYLVHQPAVASVIVGMTKPEHITRNQRARQLRLTPEMLARVHEVTNPLKLAMGPNLDLWQGGDNGRCR